MALNRRMVIGLIGGGVVAAAVSAGAFVATRTPYAALAPWDLAGSYDDMRLNALSYALLAPNPHNIQPWLVELQGTNALRIHRDRTKVLPETDPFDRQITIGFGCFLEQMVIAASAQGFTVDITLFPEGEDGPVADAVFTDGATPDPLAAFIMARRSCKEPFEDKAVPGDLVAALAPFAAVHDDPAMVSALQELTVAAWDVETYTPRTLKESIDLTRVGKAEINANPDGIDLGGAFFDTLKLAGLISPEQMLDTSNVNFTAFHEDYVAMLRTTPAYVSLVTDGNARADQIAAGRRWLRLNLKTTELGLALHPVSQVLQEYPEMSDLYQTAHEALAAPGQTVQMLGRLGYGPQTPRTPRWPVDAKRLDV